VFLINRLPTSVLGYKSPHEVVFGSAPTYDSFREFGCSCYPLLAPFGRSKLDFKSIRCVFLGYSTNHKGYICFEPRTHRFYISRYVKFNELQFPCKCMQPPDTHASQLFQIKALPRLLKTVAKKSIATATQVSSHDPATIVPHTETAQEASASQSAASASLSSSTAAENPVRPVISLASAPPSQRQHHMITHTQTGKLKPKVFISSRHPIPACFIADLVAQRQEPSSVQQALQHLHWIQAMQAEMDALHNNKTWTLVPRQANMNIISSKWVFKIKT